MLPRFRRSNNISARYEIQRMSWDHKYVSLHVAHTCHEGMSHWPELILLNDVKFFWYRYSVQII